MAKSAAPLLLVAGGAALLLMGGKKKKKATKLTAPNGRSGAPAPHSPMPLPPPAKAEGSGYSNVTRERMQWIQTSLAALGYDVGSNGMDGRYSADTKAAVWEFQTDHEDVLGNPDGKPGKNTQAMLEQALAGRGEAQSQGQVPQDECDPLDPSTWGIGNMCVIEDGRWVRVSAAADTSDPSNFPDTSVDGLYLNDWDSWPDGIIVAPHWNGPVKAVDLRNGPSNINIQTSPADSDGMAILKSGRVFKRSDYGEKPATVVTYMPTRKFWNRKTNRMSEEVYVGYLHFYYEFVDSLINLAYQYPNINFIMRMRDIWDGYDERSVVVELSNDSWFNSSETEVLSLPSGVKWGGGQGSTTELISDLVSKIEDFV